MRQTLFATLILAAIFTVPAVASSDHDKADQAAARAALARHEILPIDRILGIARGQVPGDVLSVKLKRKPAGFEYHVKMLASNGRVREVEINARTGAVLEVEDD